MYSVGGVGGEGSRKGGGGRDKGQLKCKTISDKATDDYQRWILLKFCFLFFFFFNLQTVILMWKQLLHTWNTNLHWLKSTKICIQFPLLINLNIAGQSHAFLKPRGSFSYKEAEIDRDSKFWAELAEQVTRHICWWKRVVISPVAVTHSNKRLKAETSCQKKDHTWTIPMP